MKRFVLALLTTGLWGGHIFANDPGSPNGETSLQQAVVIQSENKEVAHTAANSGSNPLPATERESVLSPERREDLISKQARAESSRKLDVQGAEGVALSAAWASKSASFQSQSTVNGSVVLTFNASFPTIVAAVLQLTDVELQASESVTSVTLGDTARWVVIVTTSHDGELQRPHLIIKPMDEGLKTSLVVTTSKRTYHLILQSSFEHFMHYVTFAYPDDPEVTLLKERREEEAKMLQRKVEKAEAEARAQLPKPIVPGPALESVKYDIEGEAPWKPLHVYTDGIKTYIQMPSTMSQTEAPSLLLLRRGKGWLGYDKVIVNYRLQNQCYIVDSVVDRAILVIGRDKVTLTKKAIPSATNKTEVRRIETVKVKTQVTRDGK